jgi:hypothetical protein
MSGFLVRRVAVMPRSACIMVLPGVRGLMVGPRYSAGRTYGEHSRNQETEQRTRALVHSIVPLNQPDEP